jgi:putative ATP-dependent endonuclease of OLD family
VRLTELTINNFRGIKALTIPLDDTTVLVGENNCGKTTILDSLKICLGRSQGRKGNKFVDFDYHLANKTIQPTTAEPIQITLKFSERKENEWPDAIVQSFEKAVQVDATSGLNSITLRYTSGYDDKLKEFTTQWDFLDGAGNALTAAKNPRLLAILQQMVPVFYLAALRNAAQEFQPRSQFWGPFVKSIKLSDTVKKEIEDSLSELNKKVLDSHTTFADIKERLKKTRDLVPLGGTEPVHIEALPGRVFELLNRTQVMLTAHSEANIPLANHGEGTQSLAVLFLFDAFLKSQLKEEFDEEADPILALEEPEAHLHPSAIRTLGTLLQELHGQKIIATHSGDLLASTPLYSLRKLARKNGGVKLFRIVPGFFTPDEEARIEYHIRSQRGHMLFARSWLIIEGQSESRLLPEFAKIKNCPFDSKSVCCIEFPQIGSVDLVIKLADNLGIDWHVMVDNDGAGNGYAQVTRTQLNGRTEADHLTILPEKDIEHYLWKNGFSQIYENEVTTAQRATVTVAATDPTYPSMIISLAKNSKGKPYLATAVALEVNKKGATSIPTALSTAIDCAIRLARSNS